MQSPEMLSGNHSTKFIVMTLLGDYVQPRGGAIWLADLLYLLELLDIGERTARSTINRMAQRGWFNIQKDGRQSRYVLTPYGEGVLQGGHLRLGEEQLRNWDGVWHMVSYSLPENKRKLRNDLRKQLHWLGFGQLGPGLWISPHNRRTQLNRILYELQLLSHAHLFSGTYWGPQSNSQLIQQCWDLPELERGYRRFLTTYQPILDIVSDELKTGLAPDQAFQRRFWLTAHFFPFWRSDPNLPVELLPLNWIGTTARELFFDHRALLTPLVDPFIDAIVSGGYNSSNGHSPRVGNGTRQFDNQVG